MGTWHLYDVSPSKSRSSSFDNEAKLKHLVKDGEILCFFEDGTYSDFKGDGSYKNGKWKFSQEDKSIYFTDSDRIAVPIAINIENNLDGKQILTLMANQNNVELKFVKEAEPIKVFEDDPFYGSNNKWRLKPKQPENPLELSKRLSNYLKHLALVLKAAKERNQAVVSFEFSQGPVKIYNGGIGIHPYDIVPETWKNSFYDPGEASTAYHTYENYLIASQYKGAGIGNWIEDDYNILLSIYSDISQSSNP